MPPKGREPPNWEKTIEKLKKEGHIKEKPPAWVPKEGEQPRSDKGRFAKKAPEDK